MFSSGKKEESEIQTAAMTGSREEFEMQTVGMSGSQKEEEYDMRNADDRDMYRMGKKQELDVCPLYTQVSIHQV